MSAKEEYGVAIWERFCAILDCEHIFKIWGVVEPDLSQREEAERRARGGRPREYPLRLVVLLGALVDVWRSARACFTEFEYDERYWREITRRAAEHGTTLPSAPPTRGWYVKAKRRLSDSQTRELQDAVTGIQVRIAEEIGLIPPHVSRNTSRPLSECLVACDGKVIHPPSRFVPGDMVQKRSADEESGEIVIVDVPRRNVDPDAKKHSEGGRSEQVHGSKFWHAEVRGDTPHSRVILRVAHVPDEKGRGNSEGHVMEREILALTGMAPGIQAMTIDGVMRDKYRTSIIRQTGIKVISPAIAKSLDGKTGDREEKQRYLRTESFEYADGTHEEVDIWAVGGALCRVRFTEDGTRTFEPLPRTGNRTTRNKDGTWNDYVEYALADPRTGDPRHIRERTTTDQADERAGFKRGEYIHQIPPTDPHFRKLKGQRNDSESINSGLDDRLYRERARSYGANAVLFDLIGHQLDVGAVALSRNRPQRAKLGAAA